MRIAAAAAAVALIQAALGATAVSQPQSVPVPGASVSTLFGVSASELATVHEGRQRQAGADDAGVLPAQPMLTYHEHDYHVAHLTSTSAVRVAVRRLDGAPMTGMSVRPLRLGIQVHTAKAEASFTVPAPASRPYYLLVEVMGVDDKLVVLVDAPVSVPAALAHVSIRDFGADPTGAMDSTAAIQHALDVPRTQGKPTLVLVPPGQFTVSAALTVGSHTTLFLEAGAVIRSTADRAKLPPPPSSSCAGNLVPLVELEPGARNVTIDGLGRLDANGFALMSKDTVGNCSAAKGWLHRRRLLTSAKPAAGASSSSAAAHADVTVRGVTLADSTTWTLAIEDVDRMSVAHVKVLNHKNATIAKIENDGIDLVSTRDAAVRHCFVMTVDDAMCAKASSTETRNNTFSDNTVFTSCAANKVCVCVCVCVCQPLPSSYYLVSSHLTAYRSESLWSCASEC